MIGAIHWTLTLRRVPNCSHRCFDFLLESVPLSHRYTDSMSPDSDFAQEKGQKWITIGFFSLLCNPTIHWNHRKGRKYSWHTHCYSCLATSPANHNPISLTTYIPTGTHTQQKGSLGFKNGDECGPSVVPTSLSSARVPTQQIWHPFFLKEGSWDWGKTTEMELTWETEP